MNSRHLAGFDTSEITILYLAPHAPLAPTSKPESFPHPEYGMAEKYNYEIFTILQSLGFKVIATRTIDYLTHHATKIDYVFSLYNQAGFRGSEIFSSLLCEFFKIPYLGAPPHIRATAEDKHLAKVLARHLHIPTPDWVVIDNHNRSSKPSFPGPYFVKPRFGAQSKHIDETSIQNLWPDAIAKSRELNELGIDVIIEQFVEGTNATVPIIGGNPPLLLPIVQSRSLLKGEVITRPQKKFLHGGLEREILRDKRRTSQIQEYALRLYANVSPLDYTRIDFRLPYTESSDPIFLEFNVCPNLGSHSTIVFPAQSIGITQEELVSRILEYSFCRQNLGLP